MDQYTALYKILTFDEHRETAIDAYLMFNDESFRFLLTKDILLHVLDLCIQTKITLYDLEEWACFVDARDEIIKDTFEDYLYALSNPAIMCGYDMTQQGYQALALKMSKVKAMHDCLILL